MWDSATMQATEAMHTVPKVPVIDFPRYNMKCSGENEILRGIFHVVSGFPLHFMLYRGNLDYFLDSAIGVGVHIINTVTMCIGGPCRL